MLICPVSIKYPQWASTQRYYFSVTTPVNPAPTPETLYTTLQDHTRLAKSIAAIPVPVEQAHVTGPKFQRNKKWDDPNCQWCNVLHDDTKCYFKHPEQHAEYIKRFTWANYTYCKIWMILFSPI